MLVELCAELLRTPRVSTGENFFDLGGHSMLSLTLIARIETRCGVRLNPRVFLTNTIGQVAAMLPASGNVEPTPNSYRSEGPPSKPALSSRLLARVGKLFGR